MKIILDDLTHPKVIALLEEHLQDMHAVSPPESVHALDLDELRQPEINFWSIWEGENLAGCVAMKQHDDALGEIKSMRTSRDFHRRGIASKLLNHVLDSAKSKGLQQVSLETGIEDYFEPARAFYQKFGFEECGPFAQYTHDPNSVFMTLELG